MWRVVNVGNMEVVNESAPEIGGTGEARSESVSFHLWKPCLYGFVHGRALYKNRLDILFDLIKIDTTQDQTKMQPAYTELAPNEHIFDETREIGRSEEHTV